MTNELTLCFSATPEPTVQVQNYSYISNNHSRQQTYNNKKYKIKTQHNIEN
jgi:hypothetical protein